jgi:peptide/nickel transport system substrate-binding protein
MRIPRLRAGLAAALAAALALSACADGGSEDGGADDDAHLIFGTAGEALTLDPSFVSDGESIRVARQIFDTLIQLRPGTADIEGALAETWEADDSGTVWTFNLRDGVQFHDGTDFNAEAVCYNFDRWNNFTGVAQEPSMTYYWQQLAGGFANNNPDRGDLGESNYVSCDAPDDLTAVVTLRTPSSKFPALLVLQPFSMHSPTALEEYGGNTVEGTADEPAWSEYAESHPTGTGPFMFDNWDRANQEITLVRNENYWGDNATIGRLTFKAIPDENARRQELLSGGIHGYDYPSPADWDTLRNADMNLEIRDSLNLLYMAITQESHEALEDIRVRQAIAHALDRQAVVNAIMPDGAEVASQFQPPALPGWNADVITYDHDPDLARQLLSEAGYEEGELELTFYWPTEVTRPYMPDPQSIAELLISDLEDVGIVIDVVSLPWSPTYLADVQDGKANLHLLGWTGDYPDAYNFIGTWHSRYLPQWGYQNQELFDKMAEADSNPNPDEREVLYEELNAMIMEFLPGVPISHTPPAIVFDPSVSGVVPGPLADERFYTAQISD